MNCYFTKITTAIAFFLGLSSLRANSLQAAVIKYDINVTITSGSSIGQKGFGSFSYHNSSLVGLGDEVLPVSSVTFNFLGSTFNKNDAATSPTVAFIDGAFLGLDYIYSSPSLDFSIVSGFFDVSEALFTYSPTPGTQGVGDISYTIPEPSMVLGILLMGGLGLRGRRQKR